MKKILSIITLALLVGACSDQSSETSMNEDGTASYSSEHLQELFAKGEQDEALRLITAKAQQRKANVEDFILLAEIHNSRLNGQAAELAIDQAKTLGATQQGIALQLTKALMLQQRFEDAKKELQLLQYTRANGTEINLLEGDIAQALGNPDNARRYYGFARDISPNDPRIDVSMAILEMSEGNFEVAKELARSAIEKNSAGDTSKPYYVLGAIDRLQGNSPSAIANLQKALAVNSDDVLAQLELIGAYLDTDETEKAELVLDSLIALSPQNPLAQFYVAYILADKGNYREAEDTLIQSPDLLNKYRPAKRLYGHVAYNLEKFDTAASYLERYLADIPSDTETRLALADSHTKTNRPAEALKVLEPIVANPDNASEVVGSDEPTPIIAVGPVIEAIARAGEAEQAAGNIPAARQQYQKAITLASEQKDADTALIASLKAVLASLEFNNGNRDKGLQLMQEATADDTTTVKQLITLANMQMISGKLAEARSTAQRIESASNKSAVSQNILGTVELRLGNYQAAAKALSAALEINPEYASALKNRAAAYIALDQYENALPDLLALKPQAGRDGQYYGMLGRTQLSLKNYVAAIDAYATAKEIIPNSALFTANYASALGAKERYDEAIEQAKAALELAPNDEAFKTQVREMLTRYEAAAEEIRRSGK